MRYLTAISLLLTSTTILAAIPATFKVEVQNPHTLQISAYRGETIDIAVELQNRGKPLAVVNKSATLYWQTNGMNQAWWTAPALITDNGNIHATWRPEYDVGAASYRMFIGVTNANDINYRANFVLRLMGSPGGNPNCVKLPISILDFDKITHTNAPWLSNPTMIADGSESILFGGENLITMRDVKSGKTTTLNVYGVESNGEYVAWPVSDGTLVTDKDLVATYGMPDAQMRVDSDNLSIEQFDGDTNIVIWSSSSSTSDEVAALRAECEALLARIKELESRPDLKNWGDYAPDGTPNPDSETLLFNRAMTLFGSGFSWETSGTAAVLVQSGAVAFATGSDGEMRLGLDHATNYIAIVSGGMITVGARAGSIDVDPAKHLVTIDYDYAGSGDYPVVWYCTDLIHQNWQIAEGGTWTYVPGNNYATFNFSFEGMPRAFFKATTSVRGDNYFYSPLPAVLQGGIKLSADTQDLIKFNSIVTIEKDGKTYKVIAEEVR